jgi:hypothetical protein
MIDHNPQHDVCDDVLKKIQEGEVHMTPKAFFTVKVIALVLTILALLVTSGFLVSYIIFSIKASGQAFLLGFGGQGFLLFFLLFPWMLLAADIILWIILEWFLRDFKICYRYPLSYVFLAVLVISVFLGIAINATPLHDLIMRRAEQKKIPVVGGFYDHLRRPPREFGEYRGIVMSIGTSTFIIHDELRDGRDATWTINIPAEIQAQTIVRIGDRVFIAGKSVDATTVRAFGIRKFMPPYDGDE